MASHRKPKGVYNRDTRDWFVDSLAWISWVDVSGYLGIPANQNLFSNYSFTNNDGLGRAYHVQLVQANFAGGAASCIIQQANSPFAFVTNCQAARLGYPQPSGFLGLSTTYVPGFSTPNPLISAPLFFVPTFGGATLGAGGTLFILYTGQTVQLLSDEPSNWPNAVAIQYAILPSGW